MATIIHNEKSGIPNDDAQIQDKIQDELDILLIKDIMKDIIDNYIIDQLNTKFRYAYVSVVQSFPITKWSQNVFMSSYDFFQMFGPPINYLILCKCEISDCRLLVSINKGPFVKVTN